MDEIVGSHIISLDSVDSTNNFAAKLISEAKPVNGTAILASFQEMGKGQRGATWQSVRDMNFLCSVILYPHFLQAEEQFYLSKAVAVAIQRAISSFDITEVKVKWPNDIFINEAKVGGVLIENSLRGSRIESSIVGMGINVNQTEFETAGPTSLKKEKKKEIQLEEFRISCFDELNKVYRLLSQRAFQEIDDAYHSLLFGRDQLKRYLINGEIEECKVSHVDRLGLAHLQCNSGKKGPFSIREIKLIQD